MPYTMTFDEQLLVIRFHGTLTGADLLDMTDELIAFERIIRPIPDRLVDLQSVEEFTIETTDLEALAAERTRMTLTHQINTAIVARTPRAIEVAATFQRLNTHPMVTLRLFEREGTARAWLCAQRPAA